jgi:hypothetical protein
MMNKFFEYWRDATMKNISKHLLAFTAILFLIGLMPAPPAHAAIFASDAVYLFSGGKRIADNSVLVFYTEYNEERLEICSKGSFWLRQGPTWKAGPYTFITTTHKDILTIEKWFATAEGKASRDPSKDYQDYLRKKTANALGRIKITIPTVKESPALDLTPNPPPRPGMAEGKLGYDRFFRVDLNAGTITQVPRCEIFKDSGK